MRGGTSVYPRPGNHLAAVVVGTLVATTVLLAGSYLLTRFGVGLFGSEAQRIAGIETIKRAGLNAFAVQCISLSGAGSISSGAGEPEAVRAWVALPVTVWMCLPFLALIVGGYCGGCVRRCDSVAGAVSLCCFLAVAYGAALAMLSLVISAQMDAGLLPEIGGVTVSPPMIDFSPSFWSTLGYGVLYGMMFSYLGVAAALRRTRPSSAPGQWWVSGKSVVTICAVISVLFGAVLSVRMLGDREESGARWLEMVPAACGIAYSMLYGGSAVGRVTSEITALDRQTRPLYARAGLYTGLQRSDDNARSVKPFGAGVLAGGIVVAFLASLFSGFFAVKWGSRDGSLPTACRVLVVQIGCLLVLALSCRLAITSASSFSSTSVYVGIAFGPISVIGLAVSFLSSMLGASIATSRGAGVGAYGQGR